MYYSNYDSPVGKITLTSDGKNLTHLHLKSHYFEKNTELKIFKLVKYWLDQYFMGKNPAINFSVLYNGTKFQMMVWQLLKSIPYGVTTTYSCIAKKIAEINSIKTMASQAVGKAVGLNPIPIIIPCHRVIGKNNTLVGYSGGLDIKIKLLKLENSLNNIKI